MENNPELDISLKIGESVLREGIKKFTDEVARLWITLANFFARSGLIEKARDVFEEAISSVSTVRDLTFIFSAY